ncbi:hypothetical protein POX_e06608 [Penicillium oxalicum]|uniref:hypothetical protein n=1 Tax=Penicillium oxalicum TaxID=69781 RepID=UPI0020B8F490|nr:hypothetical protein POX_e06608 [Penicillium oxalicum]KAI2788589.1 hypothetical protein POX_e06608 [Penicillium oxalicum]
MFVEDLTIVVETAIMLSLRYRYIGVSLLRDPQGGPHRILIEFKFEYTKGFLGSKDE